MFCCTLLYVHYSIAVVLMGKRELIALLGLSSWCLVMVERLFLAVPRGCLQFVIVVFPDHTHLLFLTADSGVTSTIPARSHTFMEIDHEIISAVILLPSAESFKKGCCQLQAKECARSTGYLLVQACPGKSVTR